MLQYGAGSLFPGLQDSFLHKLKDHYENAKSSVPAGHPPVIHPD